jgi:MFS family permease
MKRKLPIIDCVKHALRSMSRYRVQAVRIALPWVLVITALNVANIVANPDHRLIAPDDPTRLDISAADAVLAVVVLIATASASVNWHRYILRDEVPPAGKLLRLDGTVLKYALMLFGITVIAAMTAVAIAVPASLLIPRGGLLAGPAMVLAGALALRLSVALPAVALDRTDFGPAAAFRATQGNGWRIAGVLAISIALMLGALLAASLLSAIMQPLGWSAVMTATMLVSIPLNLLTIILAASLLNALYGFFVEARNF